MRKRFHYKGMGIALIFLLGILAVWKAGSLFAAAVFEESRAVHIISDDIENATLIIGTHLIYIGSLTDEIYTVAEESEAQSGQYGRYYKSELSQGAWYDITDAYSLADITTQGMPVSKESVEALFFTHHTRSDGKTYDLRTGEPVCIYDITDPYQLETLQELEPVKQQYENLSGKTEPSVTDESNMAVLKKFFEKDLSNPVTKSCDKNLKALQSYLLILTEAQADPEDISAVQSVMESVDAKRRAEVLSVLLDTELEALIHGVESSGSYVDYDLLAAIGDSMELAETSLTSHQSKILTEGSGILSKVRFDLSQQLIDSAREQEKETDYTVCDDAVEGLVSLSRVEAGSVVEPDLELSFLETVLIPEADLLYRKKLSSGASDEYQAALASKSARAVLNQLLRKQKNDADIVRVELQFILQAKLDRQTSEEAGRFIKERLSGVQELKDSITGDAFLNYGTESAAAYEEWLSLKLKGAVDSLGDNEMDTLLEEKSRLLQQKLEALDHNDLKTAKKLEAMIEAKDADILKLETALNHIIQSSLTSTAEKAEAAAMLGANSSAANINARKETILARLREGDYTDLANDMEGIKALMENNPESALGACKDIYQELAKQRYLADDSESGNTGSQTAQTPNAKALEDAMKMVENTIAEHATVLTGKLTPGEVTAVVEEMLGSSFEDMGSQEQVAAVLAVNLYGKEAKDISSLNLSAAMAEKAAGSQNPYLFEKLKSGSSEYISLKTIGSSTGYRYIFHDSQKQAVLEGKGCYYMFQAFSTEVRTGSGEPEFMDQPAGFQSVIYIPSEYAKLYFGCETIYLDQSDYAVLSEADMTEQAMEVLDRLLRKGAE